MKAATICKLLPRAAALSLLLSAGQANAGKVEAGMGYFNMNVNNAGKESTIASLGLAYFAYRQALLSQLEMGAGMTLLMPEGIGSEVGFGFDLNASYYPFSLLDPIQWNDSNVRMDVWDIWRPFVSAGIQQRSVQATSFPIAPTLFGFGAGIGAERTIQNFFSVRGEATYYLMTGPAGITSSQMDFKLGVSLRF